MADVEQEHRPTMSVEPPEYRRESATCEMQQPAKPIVGKEFVQMPTEAPTGSIPPEPTPLSGLSVVHREDTIEATPENGLRSPLSGAAQGQTPRSPDSAVDGVDAFLSSLEDPEGADTEHVSVPPTTVVAQARVPRSTPDHRLTTEELRSLRKPGDTVTTASGHKIEVLEDGGGRLLFLSQPSVVSTTNESHEEPPTPISRPPPKKGRKRGSMITSVDLRNIIDITEEESEHVAVDTPPTYSMPPSTYSLRNRRATQGKLVYDVKYHPMDDSIRPTQAAKRRSAHGEIQVISNHESDASETFSVHAEPDDEGEYDREIEEKAKPVRKDKKRARHCSTTPEPIRRSSRRTTKPKMSYNMNVHPQDRDLEVSSDNDSDVGAPWGRRKRQKISRSTEKNPSSPAKIKDRSTAMVIGSEVSYEEDEESVCNDVGGIELKDETTLCEDQDDQIKMSSPLSVVTTPPPYGIRQKEGLDVWFLKPGERYFRHDKDSWPNRQRPAFDIYTERLEDQLAVEANALSPLNYDHEDKENDVTNIRSEEAVDPTDSMTVMPAPQYRSLFGDGDALSHHPPAMDAFYTINRMFSPYDLGGSDGANDRHNLSTQTKSIAAAMSILASSDHLPSASDAQKIAQEPDSVCGLPSSADSVCG